MRIMIVTDQYAPMVGGVPSVSRALALGLARRGHRVALLAPGPGWRGGPGADEQVSVSYRGSVPWPWYEGMRLACVPGSAGRALITAFGPDVIHIHSPVTLGVTARIGARRLGIPVVYTNHYLPVNVRPSRQRRPRAFDALFYSYVVGFSNSCSHVTAPTATALRLLRDHGLRVPSRVISNGVDLQAYSPGPADERIRDRYGLLPGRPLILSVGRLSPEKRVDVLLGAAARLTGDAQVAIAGTGPDEGVLHARADQLGLSGRVRFLGFVPGQDLPGLYRLADIFAIPSEAELQSLTTMEAMATGLPVVAADAGALAELVCHGRNGFLASPGRAGEMAAYLDILMSDPGRRVGMGAESLRIISGHDQHRSLAKWESLYGMLTATGPGDGHCDPVWPGPARRWRSCRPGGFLRRILLSPDRCLSARDDIVFAINIIRSSGISQLFLRRQGPRQGDHVQEKNAYRRHRRGSGHRRHDDRRRGPPGRGVTEAR